MQRLPCALLSRRAFSSSAPVFAGSNAALPPAPAGLLFPHSDLSYRALLRNLRLLTGMRGGKSRFTVLVTGVCAPEIAASMFAGERDVAVDVAGDGRAADFGAIAAAKGRGLDAVLITQAYHSLRADAALDLRTIREALCDEEGTLGLLWHRAVESVRSPPLYARANGWGTQMAGWMDAQG